MKKVSRRKALTHLVGAATVGASGVFARRGIAAPPIAKGTVFTVSTWGGVTQDAVAAHAGPEFTRATGATLCVCRKLRFGNIGGEGRPELVVMQ